MTTPSPIRAAMESRRAAYSVVEICALSDVATANSRATTVIKLARAQGSLRIFSLGPVEDIPICFKGVVYCHMVVHLLDGTYELFRHFYGLRRFTKGEDRPYGPVVGVLQTVVQMIENGDTYLGVATN